MSTRGSLRSAAKPGTQRPIIPSQKTRRELSPTTSIMNIGPYQLENNLIVAPMAGVTDRPFRKLCRRLGAGFAVSEMITANCQLNGAKASARKADHTGEPGPASTQIAGADPQMLAQAARYNVELGAEIIDINMGCPAKKVCKKLAGSALLKDEALVTEILEAVVGAVDVPVTLKIRTGWDTENRNGPAIARIAEDSGIAALAVHGRTRACKFMGEAEYETIADIKSRVSIPVIANGDINSPERAKEVIDMTGVDAVMVGRSAQGRPWIFKQIDHYLKEDELLADPVFVTQRDLLLGHLAELYDFYGEFIGVRTARKHIGWYVKGIEGNSEFRARVNVVETAEEQTRLTREYFDWLIEEYNEPGDTGVRKLEIH